MTVEIWVDHMHWDVYRRTTLTHERFIWERIYMPRDLVKQIIERYVNPNAGLLYWVHQWEEDE